MTNKWIFGYIEPKYQFMYPKWTKKNQSSCILILRNERPVKCWKYKRLFSFIPFQAEPSWKPTLLQQMCFQGQPICKLLYPKWTKHSIAQNYVLCQWEQNTKVPKMQSPTGLHFNHHTFCQNLYCNIIIIKIVMHLQLRIGTFLC